LDSRVFSPPTFTLICMGLASASLARLIFNTPLSCGSVRRCYFFESSPSK
jgi:hypothetical protein